MSSKSMIDKNMNITTVNWLNDFIDNDINYISTIENSSLEEINNIKKNRY